MSAKRLRTVACLLLLCLMIGGSASGKQWKIDFQGDENHGGIYGQTDPVDMTEEGVFWNIFEVPALDAVYPGPASFAEGPTALELLDVDGQDWDVVFTDLSDAWGWAGSAGQESLPMAGDYLIILSSFGVDCDPTYWEITGLAPGSDCTLTFDACANGDAARTCNFVVNEVTTAVTGAATTSTITVVVDETGKVSGTVASGPAEGNWSGLVIDGTPAPHPEATVPQPADQQTDVLFNTELQWKVGTDAVAHDIYLGMSLEDVTNATRDNTLGVLIIQGQAANTLKPGNLEFGQTYYWRVDEVTAGGMITKGLVWSFVVEPLARTIEGVVATTNTTYTGNQSPTRLVDGSGLNANDQHSADTEAMWAGVPNATEPSYVLFEFDGVYKLHEMLVWNYNMQFEMFLGYGVKTATMEYSEDGTDWSLLGDFELAQGSGTATYSANSTIPFEGVAARFVRMTVISNFAGNTTMYGLSEVRFMQIPAQASRPQPADGATNVPINSTLSWRTGREAASHEIYLGTDPNALELHGTATQSSYAPSDLSLDAQHYWQVVEVNNAEAISSWAGPVWTFSTEPYITVDSFETYTDDFNANEAIWQTWIDGWDDNTNGSQVGYSSSPFAEQTIIHSGTQSMPLFFDNGAASAKSEAERTFAPARDWSAHGITSLSLWFYGESDNTGRLYVKVNGTKMLYNGEADDISKVLWQPWNIDLSTMGVNLSAVTSLVIGVEGAGQGRVFIDDIRLYPGAPQYVTPAEPDAANLVAYYPLDGNANDSSGNGYNGTEQGGCVYVTGVVNQALDFNGADGYVNIANASDWPAGTAPRTMAAWLMTRNAEAGARFAVSYGTPATGQAMFLGMIGTTLFGGGYGDDVTVGNFFVADEWYHTGLTYDGTTARLYANGREVASGDRDWNLQLDRTRIGQQINDFSEFWDGAVDEVYIYGAALTPEEMAHLAGRTEPVHVGF